MADIFELEGSLKLDIKDVIDGLKKVDDQVDKSSKSLEKAESSSGNFGKAMSGIGKTIAGSLSFNIVKDFAMDCVKGLDDIYRSNAKLEAIFKSTGKATQSQIDDLKQYATALEGVGVVDDDVTKTGMAQLATFNLTSDSIKTLSSSMLDLIVNQKGVNATQEDAMGMANLIGKVMTGQTSALSRYGITLSEAQEQVLKFGSEQERASMLAEVLSQNIGGVNEAISQTPEGKIKQMQMSIDGMKDTLGEALLPLILSVVQGITNLANWFGNLSPTTQKFVLVGGLLIAILPSIIGMISGLTTIMGALGISVTAVALPFLAIVAVVAGVIAIGVLLWKNWDTIKEKASQLGNWLGEKWQGIKDKTSETWENMKAKTSEAWANMKSKIQEHGGGIKGVIGTYAEANKQAWSNAFNAMDNATGGALGRLKDKISNGLDSIKNFFSNLKLPEIKIPHINLPHFNLSGSFSLKPPSVPKLNVDWYSEGAIFTKKTVLGNGLGVGDANKGQGNNAEGIIPLDILWDKFDKVANRPINVYITARELARAISPEVKSELEKIQLRDVRCYR